MVLDVVGELVRCLLPVLTCSGLDASKHVKRLRRLHLHLVVDIQWMCLVMWLRPSDCDANASRVAPNVQDVDTLVDGGIQHLEHSWWADTLETFGCVRRHCGKRVFVLTFGEFTVG